MIKIKNADIPSMVIPGIETDWKSVKEYFMEAPDCMDWIAKKLVAKTITDNAEKESQYFNFKGTTNNAAIRVAKNRMINSNIFIYSLLD